MEEVDFTQKSRFLADLEKNCTSRSHFEETTLLLIPYLDTFINSLKIHRVPTSYIQEVSFPVLKKSKNPQNTCYVQLYSILYCCLSNGCSFFLITTV